MKKAIALALLLATCIFLTACGVNKEYRADVTDFCNTVLEESQNLEYMHDYMWGWWTSAQNKDGTISDADSMVVSALENVITSYDDWDIVKSMENVASKYSAISEVDVSGKDKEIKSYADKIYNEYCNLNSLVISPAWTRDAWSANVYESLEDIRAANKEILKLISG